MILSRICRSLISWAGISRHPLTQILLYVLIVLNWALGLEQHDLEQIVLQLIAWTDALYYERLLSQLNYVGNGEQFVHFQISHHQARQAQLLRHTERQFHARVVTNGSILYDTHGFGMTKEWSYVHWTQQRCVYLLWALKWYKCERANVCNVWPMVNKVLCQYRLEKIVVL